MRAEDMSWLSLLALDSVEAGGRILEVGSWAWCVLGLGTGAEENVVVVGERVLCGSGSPRVDCSSKSSVVVIRCCCTGFWRRDGVGGADEACGDDVAELLVLPLSSDVRGVSGAVYRSRSMAVGRVDSQLDCYAGLNRRGQQGGIRVE